MVEHLRTQGSEPPVGGRTRRGGGGGGSILDVQLPICTGLRLGRPPVPLAWDIPGFRNESPTSQESPQSYASWDSWSP